VVIVSLSEQDKNTKLTDNMKYMARLGKVKNGSATREEALYVKLCQMQRRGKADPLVIDFINGLSGE